MYKKILLPIHLGHARASRKAVLTAVELARLVDGEIFILTVVPATSSMVAPFLPETVEKEAISEAKRHLSEFIAEAFPTDVKTSSLVRVDSVYRRILETAKDLDVDAIVMASHHPELGDYLLGTNAAKVVRHADCSVFIVRD